MIVAIVFGLICLNGIGFLEVPSNVIIKVAKIEKQRLKIKKSLLYNLPFNEKNEYPPITLINQGRSTFSLYIIHPRLFNNPLLEPIFTVNF